MNKKSIKIEGIYNDPARHLDFNIFCNILIDFDDLDIIKMNVKICQIDEDNLVNFDESTFITSDEIIKNTLNIINNLKNNDDLQGEIDTYLQNLINFLFQYIYNEWYITGNITFEIIRLI